MCLLNLYAVKKSIVFHILLVTAITMINMWKKTFRIQVAIWFPVIDAAWCKTGHFLTAYVEFSPLWSEKDIIVVFKVLRHAIPSTVCELIEK